jgi:hypothetical protein
MPLYQSMDCLPGVAGPVAIRGLGAQDLGAALLPAVLRLINLHLFGVFLFLVPYLLIYNINRYLSSVSSCCRCERYYIRVSAGPLQ